MKLSKTKFGLLGSISALAIALVVTATSTYAWFSSQKEVSVNAVSVKATSDVPYLEIKNSGDADSAYTDTLTATTATKDSMSLVTPKSISNATVTWGNASSTSKDEAQKKKLTELTAVTAGSEPVLANTFVLHNASQSTDFGTISVEATITLPTSADLEKCVRVLLVATQTIDSTTTYTYCLFKQGTDGAVVVTASDLGTDYNFLPSGKDSSSDLASSLPALGTITVDVYVYFDGQDENAKTSAAISDTATTVALSFSGV